MREFCAFIFLCLSLFFAQGAIAKGADSPSPTVQGLEVSAETLQRIDALSQKKYWLRLLHYKPGWPFGRMRSLVDGPEFFFSPDGSSNPKAEMIETIRAFSKEVKIGRLGQHPQCAFPERYRFLKKELNLPTVDVSCPKLDEFLNTFKGQSVSLVFSSAFPNNPGSMFGHIFLRIKSNVRPDILDYGISYAAAVGENENGFTFMALGLTGGYKGQFSLLPYYSKVNEYTNSESRDMWEYDLNINSEETGRLLRHLWEIETNSFFNYFFFDENCAYQLLAALEIARLDWELTNFPIFVIPGEAVKRVASIPGAVTQVKFRPSLRKKLFQKFESLTSSQKSDFFNVIHHGSNIEEVSEVPVLETSATYLQYLKQKEGGKLADHDTGLLKKLLLRRSKVGNEQDQAFDQSLVPLSTDTQPELGHHPSRLGISGGLLKSSELGDTFGYFQDISFKFAYHDLMNNDVGYTRFSHIDFPGLTVRYVPRTSQVYLENLTAISITSLFPLTFLEKRFSWKLVAEYYTPKDFGMHSSHAIHLESGGGGAVHLFSQRAIAYLLLTGNIEGGSVFNKGYRLGPKLQLATIFNPVDFYKIRFGGNVMADLWQSDRQSLFYELNLDQSLSLSQSFDIRFQLSHFLNSEPQSFRPYQEGKFTLNAYF